ncbi:MAG: hypothetical protein AAF224_02480 [Pseudomonadota bacterium]
MAAPSKPALIAALAVTGLIFYGGARFAADIATTSPEGATLENKALGDAAADASPTRIPAPQWPFATNNAPKE